MVICCEEFLSVSTNCGVFSRQTSWSLFFSVCHQSMFAPPPRLFTETQKSLHVPQVLSVWGRLSRPSSAGASVASVAGNGRELWQKTNRVLPDFDPSELIINRHHGCRLCLIRFFCSQKPSNVPSHSLFVWVTSDFKNTNQTSDVKSQTEDKNKLNRNKTDLVCRHFLQRADQQLLRVL